MFPAILLYGISSGIFSTFPQSLFPSIVHSVFLFHVFLPFCIPFLSHSEVFLFLVSKDFSFKWKTRVLEHNQKNSFFTTTSSKYVYGFDEWDTKLTEWSWHVKWCSTEWITFSSLDKVGDLKYSDLNWNCPPAFSLHYINAVLFPNLNSKSLSTYIFHLHKPYWKFCFSLYIIGYLFELFFFFVIRKVRFIIYFFFKGNHLS